MQKARTLVSACFVVSIMELSAGADDRVFRLDRVSNDVCAPLARGDEELAALRRK
jgi:hypothetical protein